MHKYYQPPTTKKYIFFAFPEQTLVAALGLEVWHLISSCD